MLADTPGGRDELRQRVDALFHDMIADLEPCFAAAVAGDAGGKGCPILRRPRQLKSRSCWSVDYSSHTAIAGASRRALSVAVVKLVSCV
jgi:hypothetical protein